MIRNKQNRNAGFSLIETLVTILVSSFVFASASLMLTIGLKSYEKINTEVVLQSESQYAEHFVTELFQEASSYKEIATGSLPTGVKEAIQVVRGTETCMLVLTDKGQLLYGIIDAGEDGSLPAESEQVSQVVNRERYKTYLAKNLSTLTFSPSPEDKVVTLEFKFALLGKSYNSVAIIKLRNRTF